MPTFRTAVRRRAIRPVAVAAVVALAAGLVTQLAPTPAGAVTLVAQGSVQQVFVTGATPRATVDLLDATDVVVASANADAQGAVVFGNDPVGETPLPPGPGYRARQGLDTSPAVTVLDPGDHPAPSFYDARHLDIADPGLLPDRETGYQYLETRDGTTLSINVLPPIDPDISPPYPVLVDYSGYWPSDPDPFSGDWDHKPMWVARAAGYAVVGVNIRGTTCSGGAFSYFEKLQQLDGYDAIETIAAQPWAARVAMIGLSYPGISQLFVAETQPPHLAAISPLSTIADTYRSTLYPGGILDGGHSAQWAAERDAWAQPAAMGWVQDRIAAGDGECAANQALHSQYVPLSPQLTADRFDEPAAATLAPRTFVNRINVPTFLAQAWQDEQVGADTATMIDQFTGLGGPGEPPLRVELVNGAHAEPYTPEIYLRLLEFLDFYVAHRVPALDGPMRAYARVGFADLIGAPGIDLPPNRAWPADYDTALAQYESEPPVRVNFEQGAAGTGGRPCPDQDRRPVPCPAGYPYAAFSHQFASWPPRATRATRFFLEPDGALGSSPSTVADGSARGQDRYRYDGSTGEHTIGSSNSVMAPDPGWRWDQYPEGDSLSFLTPPLTRDTVMAGTGSVDLWLRATAPDVDLEVDVTEVRPDTKETYVQSGWLRASHRHLDPAASSELEPFATHLAADAEPLPAGEFVPVRVGIYPFAHVFRAGSQVRLTVKSPGGNRPSWQFASLHYPDNQFIDVAHSVGRPSSVVLPVQPDVRAPVGLSSCGALRGQPCRDYLPSRAPTAVSATVVDRQLRVGWAPPGTADPVTGYEVTVQPTGEVLTVPATDTTTVYPSPDPATRYSFTVRATYADGPGPWSTASLESAPSSPSSPPCALPSCAPTAVSATVVDRRLRVGWAAPATAEPVTGYEVSVQPTSEVLTVPATDTTTVYPSPDPATRYSFTVRATYADGPGPWSTASPESPGPSGFRDVPPAGWYAQAVDWAIAYGVLTGHPGGEFQPTRPTTRAQAATALWSLMGRPDAIGDGATYGDVLPGARYRPALDWLDDAGIDSGFADGSFRPRAPISRARLAVWLHRTSGSLAGSAGNTYTDVGDGAWYRADADWWQAQGIAAPSTTTAFRPNATVRRSQLAGWLWNLARTPAAWAAGYPW